MKEKLYTIPLNDAINAHDECPFCYIERVIEQDLLDFVLGNGASYMESDIRSMTDEAGFCRTHFKKMFDYGNTLGNAWILKTHYAKTISDMKKTFSHYQPGKSSFMKMKSKTDGPNAVTSWVNQREESCYICNQFKADYERYLDTFFVMYKKDEEFRQKIQSSQGFCLTHFGDLCQAAEDKLNTSQKAEFFPMVFDLMEKNMERIGEDVSWLVEKFDYQNQNADWKNSKDALQRGMQKMKGGYPADSVYKMKK
ncbi:MAG: DUF6062 family protein [Eubacteriales bacterium]